MGKFKDLTGMKFGKLKVIRRGDNYIQPSNKANHAQWWCLCECQSELPEEQQKLILVKAYNLTSGNTKSCGCEAKRIIKHIGKANKKYNRYNLDGEYGICYTYKNQMIFFDLEDYEKIKDYCWYVNCKGYAYANNLNGAKGNVFMHNIIMNNLDGEFVVDHIQHTPEGENSSLDNRKYNLRKTTQSKNCINKKMQSNNKSGVIGVCKRKDNKKWVASINIDGKHYYLGQYNTIEEAARVRKVAEDKYHNEFKMQFYRGENNNESVKRLVLPPVRKEDENE